MISCPECESSVTFAVPPRMSEILECRDCASELEVVSLEPTALALAPTVEEDWGE